MNADAVSSSNTWINTPNDAGISIRTEFSTKNIYQALCDLLSTNFKYNTFENAKTAVCATECNNITSRCSNVDYLEETNSTQCEGLFLFGGVPQPDTWCRYCFKTGEWQKRECAQEERWGACAVTLGNHIYVIGGRSREICHTTVDCVTISGGDDDEVIEPPSPMHSPRYGGAAITMSGSIYITGGCDGSRALGSAERYNKSRDEWTTIKHMREHRYWPSIAKCKGQIYVFGGRNENGYLDSAEKYDVATNAWSTMTSMSSRRCGSTATAHNNFIYVVGGSNEHGNLSTVERYDVTNDVWYDVTNMNTPRAFHGSYVMNNRLFVLGGYGRDIPQSTVESISLNDRESKWTKEASLPFVVSEHACVAV